MIDSFVYCQDFDKVNGRLDFVAHNPEKIRFFNKLLKHGAVPLESVSGGIIEDIIDPKQTPEKVFNYLGLENIESNSGKACFQEMRGKDILSKAKSFRKGDIIFARLRPYLNKVHLVEIEEGIGSTELYVIRIEDEYLRRFVLTYLLSDFTLEQTRWALTGSSLPRLTDTDFKNILIVIPKEMKEIVNKLKNILIEIESMEQKIHQTSKNLLSSLSETSGIQNPDTHISFFSVSVESMDDRLDFIWYNPKLRRFLNELIKNNAVDLGEIVEPSIEYGINDYGKEEGQIPFVNIENLNLNGKINTRGIRYIENCREDKLLLENDILVSRSRGAGVAGIVTKNEEGFTFGSYVLRMRIRQDIDINPLYVVYFLNSLFGQIQIRRLETGSTGCNINPEQLKKVKILVDKKLISKQLETITANTKTISNIEKEIKMMKNDHKRLLEKSVLG